MCPVLFFPVLVYLHLFCVVESNLFLFQGSDPAVSHVSPCLCRPRPPSPRSPAPEEEDEVLLGPEVTYGPPGLDLSCPVALSVAHCADLSGPADAAWAVRLKRRTPENKWEVTSPTTQTVARERKEERDDIGAQSDREEGKR